MRKGGELEGWKVEKLGDVCDIVNGSTPLRSNKSFWENGNISWFTIDDIRTQGRTITETKQKVTQTALEESSLRMLPINSVLLCCTASIGEYAITEIPLATNQQFNGLVVKNQKLLSPYFLFHYCATLKDKLLNLSGKTTIDFIPISRLREIEIPIPPLPEQQRIVSVLDEAFASIAQAKSNAERNLVNARELFDLTLQNFLVKAGEKWGIKSLGDVCEKVEYGSSAKSQPTGKVPVLRMGNIQNGVFDWTNLVYTSDKDEIKKYLLKHNDVLFNRTNSPELVGKTAIYKSEMPAIFAGYLIRIHRKEDLLDADYLNYFLNSDMAMKYGKTVFISSVNQANINGQKLKSYPIPLPPLAEQRAIIGRLEALSAETGRLEEIYQQKVESLEELKKSVLGKAFEGEL